VSGCQYTFSSIPVSINLTISLWVTQFLLDYCYDLSNYDKLFELYVGYVSINMTPSPIKELIFSALSSMIFSM
jgi:hypothetical protein